MLRCQTRIGRAGVTAVYARLFTDATEALQRLRVKHASFSSDGLKIAVTCTVTHAGFLLLSYATT